MYLEVWFFAKKIYVYNGLYSEGDCAGSNRRNFIRSGSWAFAIDLSYKKLLVKSE